MKKQAVDAVVGLGLLTFNPFEAEWSTMARFSGSDGCTLTIGDEDRVSMSLEIPPGVISTDEEIGIIMYLLEPGVAAVSIELLGLGPAHSFPMLRDAVGLTLDGGEGEDLTDPGGRIWLMRQVESGQWRNHVIAEACGGASGRRAYGGLLGHFSRYAWGSRP